MTLKVTNCHRIAKNLHIKYEMHSFINYTYMIGPKNLTISSTVADKPARRAASRQTAKF